jgi:hypothetical protein
MEDKMNVRSCWTRQRQRWPLVGALVCALAGLYPGLAAAAGGPRPPSGNTQDVSVVPTVGIATADTAATLTAATASQAAAPAPPVGAFVDRPSIPLDQYNAAKAAAAKRTGARPSGVSQYSSNTLFGSFAATGECGLVGDGCWVPPDVNAAVGTNQIVEIVNNHIDVYTKSLAPALLMELTTQAFFNYFTSDFTDPRVEYDALWNRWVVMEMAIDNTLHLAVSFNSDLTAGWYFFTISIPVTSLDYPQIGLSQDAVVFTYSNFFTGGEDTRTLGVAKALVYNGAGFSVPVFVVGSNATATPSNVIDQNPRMHELVFKPGVGVNNVEFRNPQAGGYAAISANAPIAGVSSVIPPDADQPGCAVPSCHIDTLDGRFQNDQTQYGDHLWAAHTQAFGALPTPRFYDIDTEGPGVNTVKQSEFFFMTGTSYDFNPSIAAKPDGRAYVNWSWDDPVAGTNPSMAFTGRLGGDPAGSMNPGINIFTSPTTLTGNFDPHFGKQRWGDTSSVRFDPSIFDRAWMANETVPNTNFWGTQIAEVRVS